MNVEGYTKQCNIIMTAAMSYDPIDNKSILMYGHAPASTPTNLALNTMIDPEYMNILNIITSKIPGTELLKINCAASSMFILGLHDTRSYTTETQQTQFSKYQARGPLGRSINDVLTYVCNTYSPREVFHYFLAHTFLNVESPRIFQEALLLYLKKIILTGRGTILSYGVWALKKIHLVALVNVQNTLYMYDYQQQYLVSESQILSVIVSQSMKGSFMLGSAEYEGYGYIDNIDNIKDISISIAFTNSTPLIDGPTHQSLTITRYITLYNSVQKPNTTLIEIIGESLDASHPLEYYTPTRLMQIAEGVLDDYAVHREIEPEFSPHIDYPMNELTTIVDARTRHLQGAAKDAEATRLVETDYRASRPYATWTMLRDILKMDIVDFVKTHIKHRLRLGGNAIMWPAEGGRRLKRK